MAGQGGHRLLKSPCWLTNATVSTAEVCRWCLDVAKPKPDIEFTLFHRYIARNGFGWQTTRFRFRGKGPPPPAASQHRVDWLDLSFGTI
jgi:hypothetical protein